MSTVDNLNTALRKTLSISPTHPLTYNVEPSSSDVGQSVIHVEYNGLRKTYKTIKIDEHSTFQRKLNDASVLSPVFVFTQDSSHELYAAFEWKSGDSYCEPSRNNLDQLNSILKMLAAYQSTNVTNSKQKFPTRGLYEKISKMEMFKNATGADIDREISRLETEVDNFIQDEFSVESISSPVSNTIFIDPNTNKCVFLNTSTRAMPPVYDALLFIFTLTDEEFRKQHFSTLITTYFRFLEAALKQKLPVEYKEASVRVLLTIVKFVLILNSRGSPELYTNMLRFFKNPLINQEDVYEIVENKLNSTEYDLVSYNMVSLDEKNGHLGEYYHLDVTVSVGGRKDTYQLFAKIMIPPSEYLRNLVRDGLANNEDFFYKTLLPMYREHGLGSLLDFSPSCYLSKTNWMLVLNDLLKEGYVSAKINLSADLNQLTSVVSAYARFTACSLMLEEKLSQKQGKKITLPQIFPAQFQEVFVKLENGHFSDLIVSSRSAMHHILHICPEITKEYALSNDEITKRVDELYDSMFPKITASNIYRNAITHGDLYLGNVLFQHGKNGNTTKSVLVDFQVLRYLPPAYDLLFFLQLNTSRSNRLKYLDQLVDFFYNEIAKCLKQFDYDPEIVFPKKSFYDSVSYMRSVSLSVSFVYATMTKADPKKRLELFHDPEIFQTYFSTKKIEFMNMMWADDIFRGAMEDYARDIMDFITKLEQ